MGGESETFEVPACSNYVYMYEYTIMIVQPKRGYLEAADIAEQKKRRGATTSVESE